MSNKKDKKLREFRNSLGISTHTIATTLGISNSLYTQVELGFKNPSYNFIRRLKSKYPQYDANLFFVSTNHEKWNDNAIKF